MAYINQFTNAFIKAVLVCRQLYSAESKSDKITMNPNNLIKTQMQSYVGNYFEASVYPVIKYGDQCGANV